MERHFLSLVLLSLLGFSSEVFACTIEIPPLRKDFRRSDSVFVGRIISVRETTVSEKERSTLPEAWKNWQVFSNIKFTVVKKWKGNNAVTKEYVGVAFFDCGCPGGIIDQFEAGKEYLVFAEKRDFLTVCLSERTGSEYVKDKMRRMDSLWFRAWARIYPF